VVAKSESNLPYRKPASVGNSASTAEPGGLGEPQLLRGETKKLPWGDQPRVSHMRGVEGAMPAGDGAGAQRRAMGILGEKFQSYGQVRGAAGILLVSH